MFGKTNTSAPPRVARQLIIASVLFGLFFPAVYARTIVIGKVKEIQINKELGNTIFIQLDTTHSSPISCHINTGWTYTLPQQTEADKKIFALISTALATGQTVRLYGSGSCNDFNSVESLSVAAIQQP